MSPPHLLVVHERDFAEVHGDAALPAVALAQGAVEGRVDQQAAALGHRRLDGVEVRRMRMGERKRGRRGRRRRRRVRVRRGMRMSQRILARHLGPGRPDELLASLHAQVQSAVLVHLDEQVLYVRRARGEGSVRMEDLLHHGCHSQCVTLHQNKRIRRNVFLMPLINTAMTA